MSRCFPYPPPGYYAKGDRNEALIESSIKLQREREKAKAERKKERNIEKKEKKRESKVKFVSELGLDEKRDRKRKTEKAPDGLIWKPSAFRRSEDKSVQFERSNLTEEHEQPAACLQNQCFSGTENSNKRTRHTSPVNGILPIHGNVLKIRLPSVKLKQSDAPVNEEKLCCSSKPIEQELFSAKTDDVCRCDKEQFCSTSGETGNLPTGRGSISKKGIPTVESLFKDLVENWVSPPTQTQRTDVDELEWLFERKHLKREKAKAASSPVLCTVSANMWPRAQFLTEADLYALPFTVPF